MASPVTCNSPGCSIVCPGLRQRNISTVLDFCDGKLRKGQWYGKCSHVTSLTIVYSTVSPGADQRKHQSSAASLAFVPGIHRSPLNSPHKWTMTRKMFPFDDVIMIYIISHQQMTETGLIDTGKCKHIVCHDMRHQLVYQFIWHHCHWGYSYLNGLIHWN